MEVVSFSAQAPSINVSVTSTASSSVNLPTTGGTVRIVNEGPNIAFVSIGAGTQTAVLPGSSALATCTPVLASSDISLRIPAGQIQQISAICRAAGTAVLTVQVSEGV